MENEVKITSDAVEKEHPISPEELIRRMALCFYGIYVVNLLEDSVDIIYQAKRTPLSPKESSNWQAHLRRYAEEVVETEDCGAFLAFCDSRNLSRIFLNGGSPELIYRIKGGSAVRLRVRPAGDTPADSSEVFWLFERYTVKTAE